MDRSLIEHTRALVASDLAGAPDVARACVSIIDYLASNSDEQLAHLTLGMLAQIAHSDEQLTSQAVAFLSGDLAKTLDLRFELIDEKGQIYPASKDRVGVATRSGVLVHPQYGVEIDNFRDKLYVYFAPTWLPEEDDAWEHCD